MWAVAERLYWYSAAALFPIREKRAGDKMKRIQKSFFRYLTCLAVMLLTFMPKHTVLAAPGTSDISSQTKEKAYYSEGVTQAKKYALKDVTQADSPAGEWIQKKNGKCFRLEDGTLLKNRWLLTEDGIYYLGKNGRMVKGWISYRENLYYTDEDGILHTGWLTKEKDTFYFQPDGTMARGLCTIEGERYYFSEKTGAAVGGWVKIGKYQYYFAPKTLKMKTSGWVKTGGKHYYVGKKGRKRKPGWLTAGEKKYYLDSDGARVTGTLYLDGKGYYFRKNGVYDPTVEVKLEVDPSKPMVALTFDDGPGKYTDRLLDCLEKNGAKATFFMVGTGVSGYPATVKRMAKLGCELGNHSYSHAQFSTLSNESIRSEISKTSNLIKNAAGQSPTVMRLPYGDGASNARVLAAVGLPSIYWSVDTRDWANTGNPQHTVNEVLNNVKNGDIVLMHDFHYSTVVAAETIIPELKRRGYQLVTVSQLAKYKGKTELHPGRTYRSF